MTVSLPGWFNDYMIAILVSILLHQPVRIGDYGHGTPTVREIDSCQVFGEMIYSPTNNEWTCEP